MSSSGKEWLIVAIFFVAFVVFTIAETRWIDKRTEAGFRRSFFFTMLSNTLAITAGFFVSFVIFGLMFMVVYGNDTANAAPNEAALRIALITALIFPFILLLLIKRLLLNVSKFEAITSPWLYSAAASALFFVVVLSFPFLVAYIF